MTTPDPTPATAAGPTWTLSPEHQRLANMGFRSVIDHALTLEAERDTLARDLSAARAALAFYADKTNWFPDGNDKDRYSPIERDYGATARWVLTGGA